MKDKKPILCHTCSNVDWQTSHGKTVTIIDMCYFPDNDSKFGKATECKEYQKKDTKE